MTADASHRAVVKAALVLLERMGLSPADLAAVPPSRKSLAALTSEDHPVAISAPVGCPSRATCRTTIGKSVIGTTISARRSNGPEHYQEADRILAEIEATPSLSNETETSLALRAQAHATLALAAATAIDPDRQREEWRDVAGTRN